MENFTKIREIDVDGVKHPDIVVQHVDGWYARVRMQRVRKLQCETCQCRFIEAGTQPSAAIRVYVAECDAEGVLISDPIECYNLVAAPVTGKPDWAQEKKRVVRHALDQLILSKSDLPDDEEEVPLTR